MKTVQPVSSMQSLLVNLLSSNEKIRQNARLAVARIGSSATPALIAMLASADGNTRLEVVKALDVLKDSAAAPALVKTLDDDSPAVRWAAAEALKSLGRPGLIALLEGLIEASCSVWRREGAHHVLRSYRGIPVIANVLAALEDVEPKIEAAIAAEAALETLAKEARIRSANNNKTRQKLIH